MKHREEPLHHAFHSSLRANEKPPKLAGDAVAGYRDMTAEQRAAFHPPGAPDHRVKTSENDQGRTR